MQTIITPRRSRTFILSAFILIALFFNACRIVLVSDYDSKIAEQIENVSKSIDAFYLTMQETTVATEERRAYNKFAEQYITIEIELQSLLNKNKARAKNEETVKMCEQLISMFEKYKNEHKQENTLSDADIKLNLEYFRGVLYPLLISELSKK